MMLNDGFAPLNGSGGSSNNNRRFRTSIPCAISAEEFQSLLMAGRIVDGRMGGMVLGKGLGDGNARLVYKIGSDYLLHDHICGGCFILNREASAHHHRRIRRMQAGLTLKEPAEEALDDRIGQIICLTSVPHDRLLWIDFGQQVVTGEAAAKHLMELEEMNAGPNPYLHCDYYEMFGCEPGTSDGCV